MIAAIAAKLGLEVALAFVKRYWKPILFGAIGVGIIATIAIQHWRINSLVTARAQDKLAIDAAVDANVQNTAAIEAIIRAQAIDRVITADAIARAQRLATAAAAHIQEIQNDPGANVPAGPEFDDLGRRLRAIDEDRHRDAH